MYCPRCGNKIEFETPNFCPKCGVSLLLNIPKPSQRMERIPDSGNKTKITDTNVHNGFVKSETEKKPLSSMNKPQEKSVNVKSYTLHLADSSMLKDNWWNTSKDKFKENWGYGWMVFAYGFFSPQASKFYDSYGEYGGILQLLGFITSMLFYYFIRQKLFAKIGKNWVRSALSVVIGYVIVSVILILAASFLNSSYSNNVTTYDWKLRTLPNAHLVIDSPTDFVQTPNKSISEYNNIIESYFNYTSDTKSSNIIINASYLKYQENVIVDIDKITENYKYLLNQTIPGISNFQCSSSEYNIDGYLGKIVHGTLEINNRDVELLAAILYQNFKLWQVICIYPISALNKNDAKRVIDSIHIED